MTTPSYNQQIVAQGLARLTSAFITKPNIRKMLAVYLQPWQDLEDATWGVLDGRILSTAPLGSTYVSVPGSDNNVFDVIGNIVGVARAGVGDLVLKTLIYLEVAVNKATGRTTDWSNFWTILSPFAVTDVAVRPTTFYVSGQAGFYFGLWNLVLDANAVGKALTKACPQGVLGVFAYSTWPDGGDFSCSSVYDGSLGQGGWGSVYDSTAGGPLVAAIGLYDTPINANLLFP